MAGRVRSYAGSGASVVQAQPRGPPQEAVCRSKERPPRIRKLPNDEDTRGQCRMPFVRQVTSNSWREQQQHSRHDPALAGPVGLRLSRLPGSYAPRHAQTVRRGLGGRHQESDGPGEPDVLVGKANTKERAAFLDRVHMGLCNCSDYRSKKSVVLSSLLSQRRRPSGFSNALFAPSRLSIGIV
jgi:hypothetical protein